MREIFKELIEQLTSWPAAVFFIFLVIRYDARKGKR
jgi:hypothetical protein